jgi:bacteriocin-like protein
MDANSRKKPTQLEINDLIAEAVVNAEARRNQAEELLSDEELAAVNGGTSLGIKGHFPIIAGHFPIIAGNFPITLA